MKYIKITISYLIKNFWRLFLTLVPASVVCAVFLNPLSSVTSLYYMIKEQTSNPRDLIENLDFATEWYYIFIYAGVVLVLSVFISYAYITVYRHLRTGKISIRSPFRYVNGGFIPVVKMMSLMGVFMILVQFILTGLLYLINVIFDSLSVPYVFFLICAFVLIIFCVLFGNHMLKTPLMTMFHMYVYGYGFAEAWSANGKLLDRKIARTMFFCTLIPFFFIIALNYLFVFVTVGVWIEVILRSVVYFFIFAYYITLSIIVMFDLCEIERRDIPAHRR